MNRTDSLTGLKDAIATLMDDNAMNENPIHSISFFGYSPQSPQQIDEHGNSKNTTDKRFMLKRAVKAKHAGVCDMGLDERDRPLQVCIANSHSKLPKPAKGLFRSGHAPSTVPGTVVCLQFEPSSLKEARTQLGRIMDAVKTHILFDATSLGHDVNVVVPKGLQPSTVFTSVCGQDPHSKVFIYPGLLLATPDTPDTEGFAVMLSKHDLHRGTSHTVLLPRDSSSTAPARHHPQCAAAAAAAAAATTSCGGA